jgi:hypothetical protein
LISSSAIAAGRPGQTEPPATKAGRGPVITSSAIWPNVGLIDGANLAAKLVGTLRNQERIAFDPPNRYRHMSRIRSSSSAWQSLQFIGAAILENRRLHSTEPRNREIARFWCSTTVERDNEL